MEHITKPRTPKRLHLRAAWISFPTSLASVYTPAFLILFLLVLGGCKKAAVKETVLAQVGNSTLTLEELRQSFPADFEQLIRREQYLDFIKRWMDDEVVYQQALKAKLENDPEVRRKAEKLRRKLLIEEYLAKENASEVFEPDEMSMNQYYEMHKEDFRRKVPEVKFMHIRVQTSKQAADLRAKANRGDFLAVAATGSLDPVPESYASIAYKKQTEFPPCLSQDIASAGIGSITLPIACPDGFYLVKVLERQDAGSLIPFAEAKEEISGILVMDRKDKMLENRIAKYKEGISFSYNLDQIPGLAESAKVAETPKAEPASVAAPVTPAPIAKPKPASAAPSQPAAAETPVSDPRLPREPKNAPAAPTVPPATPAPVVADPRLPREPDQIGAPVPAIKKAIPRKRALRRPNADSSEDGPAAPKPANENGPDSMNKTPDSEENSNAQSSIETP
ncbi:MAG: peptidyl-prolyl cis-trans isomerase [Fibrobacteria bacterium]